MSSERGSTIGNKFTVFIVTGAFFPLVNFLIVFDKALGRVASFEQTFLSSTENFAFFRLVETNLE